jgi:hypothetical protein
MDLNSLDPGEIEVPIPNPQSGDETGLVFKMISPSDRKAQLARRRYQDVLLRKPSAQKVEEASLAYITSLVTGWEWKGDLTWNGQKPMFTEKNVLEVLKEKPWVREYLDEKAGEKEAFFRK